MYWLDYPVAGDIETSSTVLDRFDWRATVTVLTLIRTSGRHADRSLLLQRAQPAMTGLIDGSLSTLAPVFAVALATHQPHYAFFAGLATAIGAGVSMIGGAIIAGVSAALGAISRPCPL
jgi:hypothetical protein